MPTFSTITSIVRPARSSQHFWAQETEFFVPPLRKAQIFVKTRFLSWLSERIRPARQRWFSLTLIGIALIVLAGCSGGGGERALNLYLMANQDQLATAVSPEDRPVRFEVTPGMSARSIGQQLEDAGLIQDATLFEAYVRVNDMASQLAAGLFTLSPSMTLPEIAKTLQRGETASVTVTLPEGWRLEQSADYLTETGVVSDDAYLTQAISGDLTGVDLERYPFLRARPAGASLEGYLFPDTYGLPAANASGLDLLTRQLDAFSAKVVPFYQDARAAGATELDLHSVLTLASIVEREAVVPDERTAIASVYLNRLANGIALGADPTVQYAMGYQPQSAQWWKTPVFLEEYGSVDSPYNTYLNPGLPPGPIASPGLESIRAVLAPDDHDYLYFVAIPDGSGAHVFANTYDEHLQNVQRYQARQ